MSRKIISPIGWAEKLEEIGEEALVEKDEIGAFGEFVLHQAGFQCYFDGGICQPMPLCEEFFNYARSVKPGANKATIFYEAMYMHQTTSSLVAIFRLINTMIVSIII